MRAFPPRAWANGLADAWLPLACGMALAAARFFLEQTRDLFILGDSFQCYAHFNFVLANLQAAGELPQWLPYATYGAPAAPYNQVFLTPFTLVAALLGSALGLTNAWALFNACVVLELFVLVIGAWLLSGELYETRAARLAVTLAAACVTTWHLQMFWSHRMLAYWPLLLFFTFRLRRLGDAADLARACLAGLLLLFGSVTYAAPVDALLVLVAFVAAAACQGLRQPLLDPASLRRPGTLAIWGVALGLLATYGWLVAHIFDGLAVLAPFRNADGSVSLDTFLTYGGLASEKLREFVCGFPAMHLEAFFYIGVMPTGLLLLALARWRDRRMLTLLLVAGFLFLLSLGPDGLVAYAAYYFPLADRFRHLSMLLPLVVLLFLFLAGFGVESLATAPDGGRRLFRVCLLAAPLMLLVKWLFAPIPVEFGWTTLLPEIGTGLCLLALLATRLVPAATPARAATAVLVLELLLGQWSMVDHFDKFPPARGLRVEGLDLGRVQPLEFNPHRLSASNGEPRWPALSRLGLRQPVNNVTLLHFAGVDLCVPIFRVDFLAEATLNDMPRLAEDVLLRSNMPMPPMARVSAAYWQGRRNDPAYRELCGCGEFSKLTLLDGGETGIPEVLRFSANRLQVRTRTTAPEAVLRYADSFDPRWRAYVDGRPAPVEDGHPFKLLRLPPGEHVAEFVFHDARQDWALRLAGVGAALALAWVLASELRRGRS